MFYLRHCSGLQGCFINTNSSALSPVNSTSSVLFSDYEGTVPYCWHLRNSSLRCYSKSCFHFLSRQTPCWRSYPRTNL